MRDYRTCKHYRPDDCINYNPTGGCTDCGDCEDYEWKYTDAYRDAESVPVVTERAESECTDAINPAHYTQGSIECIEALKAATVNLKGIEAVCTANAIKYLWRWKEKNGATDIRKCIWYCERLLKEIENGD